ncbi:MAG: tRNA (N(6)-L-threonylcarbamoyladenosine(37)-C(2))-methylthiotransferase MtaB [Bacteroidales bacterium]|nr:tRNA (N(6)-L-threonylcarbamoyladenosine(37)-C(2))-methylthiotransferase MtaB [Bacteroidales bacterium]MDD4712208.1 tRNA (N(6)-L-threonylcarbamoyladenosine(37)-C(2))-methylthiotransferase MtaB [Bacteroidales bacterium]
MIDTSFFQTRKVAYVNLGCKLNFAETYSLGKKMISAGYSTVKFGERPDVCVINTCSVTDTADKKGRQAIHKVIRQYPEALVVVIGCYAQLKSDEISEIPGVNLVLGANQKFDLPGLLEGLQKGEHAKIYTSEVKDINRFLPSCSRGNRTRYFLKVQDGCDYFCTYCTIPFARGTSRNPKIAFLVDQAKEVAAEGGKEIVLSGVNIGDFGKSTGETFIDLIRALDEVEGIDRYRISSIEPNLLTDEVIAFVAASKRFAPHFHIPLQAGSDELLKLMHRRYDTSLFAAKIDLIKRVIPHAFIGVDVIVGSRGETPERFEEAFVFLEKLDISQLHIFSYSERPGTQALKIDYIVSPAAKKARHERLQKLSDAKWKAFYQKHVGYEGKVLFEHTKTEGKMHGFSENYIRVEVPYQKNWVNQTISVRLSDFNTEGTALKGELPGCTE